MAAIRHSLVTVAAASALGVTGFAAPAAADPAGGGNYASSVATRTYANFNNAPGRNVQLRAQITSTSSVAGNMHGTVVIELRRAATGGLAARRSLNVSGPSGKLYAISVNLPKSIPGGTYLVTATFDVASEHIEKGSIGSTVKSYNPA